jgi:hypothetical protein
MSEKPFEKLEKIPSTIVYQDDRVTCMRNYPKYLKQGIRYARKKEYDYAYDSLKNAASCLDKATADNHQDTVKYFFQVSYKFFISSKKIKYAKGIEWSLFQETKLIKKRELQDSTKTKLLTFVIQYYEKYGGNPKKLRAIWKKA